MSVVERARNKIANHLHLKRIPSRNTRGALSVTFDDFPRTAWTIGGAVLREHGVRGTYYVTGELCDQNFDGIQQYSSEDLEALHEEGHEVGSHLYEHISALRLSASALRRSIVSNERFVRERLGNSVMTTFAYPYGEVSVRAKQICASTFAACRGIKPGLNGGLVELAQLKTICLEARSSSTIDLEQLIFDTARLKSWLIVLTHDIDENPSPFGCRPKDLQRLLQLAQAADLNVLPVKNALAEVVFGGGEVPA